MLNFLFILFIHSRITAQITCSAFVKKRLAPSDLFHFCLSVFVLVLLWFGGGGAQLEKKVLLYICVHQSGCSYIIVKMWWGRLLLSPGRCQSNVTKPHLHVNNNNNNKVIYLLEFRHEHWMFWTFLGLQCLAGLLLQILLHNILYYNVSHLQFLYHQTGNEVCVVPNSAQGPKKASSEPHHPRHVISLTASPALTHLGCLAELPPYLRAVPCFVSGC